MGELQRQIKGECILEDYDYSFDRPTSHLIVTGSPRYNPQATAIQKFFHLPYQYVVGIHNELTEKSIINIVTTYGEELTSSRDKRIGPSEIEVDYGILFIASLRNSKRLFWFSGIHGAGTLGVYKFFHDKRDWILTQIDTKEGSGICWLLRVHYKMSQGGKGDEIISVESLGDPFPCKQRETRSQRKVIISDLGNVIMHFDRTRTYRGIAHTCNIPYDKVITIIENSSLRQEYELGKIDDKNFMLQLSRLVGDTLGCLTENLISELWGDIFWPNNEMIIAFQQLKREGIYNILLSNTNSIHFQHICKYYPEVINIFDSVILSYQEKSAKPDMNFFEKAIEKASDKEPNLSRSDIIYVDDKAEYVDIAKRLGTDGFVYRSYPQFAFWLRKRGLYIS